MVEEKQQPRRWWLFEGKSTKDMAYVREAKGDYVDIPHRPSSPWLRKLPPTKVVENSYAVDLEKKLEYLKEEFGKIVIDPVCSSHVAVAKWKSILDEIDKP